MALSQNFRPYLEPTYFIDSGSKEVLEYLHKIIPPDRLIGMSNIEKAVELYYAVRDNFRYDPYFLDFSIEHMRASYLLGEKNLERGKGYCITKAIKLAALGRAAYIPTRLHFYIVENHIAAGRFFDLIGTNILAPHAGVDFYLNDRWVSTTPSFNKELCDKLGVDALDFNGVDDSKFQQYNRSGDQYMQYLFDLGHYSDVPRGLILKVFSFFYPQLFDGTITAEKDGIEVIL